MPDALTLWIRAKNTTARVFSGVKIGFVAMVGGIVAAAGLLNKTIREAFTFERYRTQFKILFGDLAKAKQHIKDLQEFSASTPFQFGEIAQASRSLHVFTDGVLGGTDSLKLIGDAAAASGQNIKDVSFWVGRAYSAISSGRPFGEAAMRLQEMGILSGTARNEIEELTKAGASNAEIWAVLQGELEKSQGGMSDLSKTGEGLISTLKDNWSLALAKFGAAFQDLAKEHIAALIAKLQELQKDGTIEVWADRALKAISRVAGGLQVIAKGWTWVRNKVEEAAEFWGALAGGGSVQDAVSAMGTGQRARAGSDAGIRKRVQAESKVATQAAQKGKTMQERVAEDLGKKQAGIDKKNAEKKAQAALKAEQALMRRAAGKLGAGGGEAQQRLAKAQQAAQDALGEFLESPRARRERLRQERRQESDIQRAAANAEKKLAAGRRLTYREKAAREFLQQRAKAEAAAKEQERLAKLRTELLKKIERNEARLLQLR